MVESFAWYLWVQLLGLIALPITLFLLRNLPDRGYAFSKVLGILLVSYLLWISAYLNLLPNARGSILLLLWVLALASLSLLVRRRQEMANFLRESRSLILVTEALFLLSFALWAFIRAKDPDIAATEKPMDFAFINAILRSNSFPPHDPWLSGHSLSYYYFGHLMVATLTRLSGIPSPTTFNLALALLFALTSIGGFSLVYNLVKGAGSSLRTALIFGMLGALLLVGLGNLEGVLEMLRAHGFGSVSFWGWIAVKDLAAPYQSTQWYPTDTWWWWRATRVIDTVVAGRSTDYTITEFPFFSFLLGDLHPHVMSLPFTLLAVALSQNLICSGDGLGLSYLRRNPLEAGLTSLIIGALGFLNSWDLPTYAFLFAVCLSFQTCRLGSRPLGQAFKEAFAFLGVVLVGALLLYAPFYLRFQSQAEGVLPWGGPGTRPLHYILLWGFFLFVVGSFLVVVAKKVGPGRRLPAYLGVLLPLVVWAIVEALTGPRGESSQMWLRALLMRVWPLLTLGGVLAMLPSAVAMRRGRSLTFALLLIATALLLTAAAESFYIKDVFGNRMNTVFKFYYQAWVLLAIASGFGLYFLGVALLGASVRLRWIWAPWIIVLVLLSLGVLVYPVAASLSKSLASGKEPTLNGLAFLKKANPEEYEALQWLNAQVEGAPVILEATGPEYSEYGMVSARTGLPTLLGWAGHERQWRGSDRDYRGRDQEIDELYQSGDRVRVASLMQKYGIRYVYVGHLERAKYGPAILERFAPFMEVAFQNQGVTIYKVRG